MTSIVATPNDAPTAGSHVTILTATPKLGFMIHHAPPRATAKAESGIAPAADCPYISLGSAFRCSRAIPVLAMTVSGGVGFQGDLSTCIQLPSSRSMARILRA